MSPATKSKSKDKKAGKESQKASAKLPGASNTGSGISASAYNPLLGTFHTLDPVPTHCAPSIQANSRFRNIDETDDHSGYSLGTGADYDSVSNNDSWSGESEDHKEKPANPAVKQEIIPGADNDKREKIRQKNERKHRRQKERRAQELHERCTGYLMSRKLEALAQQLVAMGFSLERATMALILNEGKVEESVTWLFEGHEEADKCNDQNLGNGSNLKIDISDELAQIADMEIRYKCSRQEVERAVVTCEGDLDKAAEALREQRQDLPSAPDENGGSPNVSYGTRISVVPNQNMTKPPQKSSNSSLSTQQKRDEKDFNYTKTAVSVGSPSDLGSKHAQPLKKVQPKLESLGLQQHSAILPEKRWVGGASNIPVSYPLTSPLPVSPLPGKFQMHYGSVGGELKNLQPGSVREPAVMIQRSKPINPEQTAATSMSSSPPGTAASRRPNPNGVSIMKPTGLLQHNPSSRSLNSNDLITTPVYWQNHQQQHQHQHLVPGCSPVDLPGTNKANSSWCRIGSSSTLAAAASLGLFSGLGSSGSSGSSSPVDWNNGGSTMNLDYSSIDWSLDLNLSSRPSGLWLGLASGMNAQKYESDVPGVGSRQPGMWFTSNMNGVTLAGMQDGGSARGGTTSTPTSHEWASPFEGNDLFNLPRQFVSPPSL